MNQYDIARQEKDRIASIKRDCAMRQLNRILKGLTIKELEQVTSAIKQWQNLYEDNKPAMGGPTQENKKG